MAIETTTTDYEGFLGTGRFATEALPLSRRTLQYVVKIAIGSEATDKYATGGIEVGDLKFSSAESIDFVFWNSTDWVGYMTYDATNEKLLLYTANGSQVAADATTIQGKTFYALVFART